MFINKKCPKCNGRAIQHTAHINHTYTIATGCPECSLFVGTNPADENSWEASEALWNLLVDALEEVKDSDGE